MDITLSFLEARVLAVLVEKEKLTPDAYPLTLNGVLTGCNQKSAREPVINIGESEIQTALERLRSLVLVLETYGSSGRVLRYAQNIAKVYHLQGPSVALMAVLVLRGPQTASELRANAERLYRFDDAHSVEAYLSELACRVDRPLVAKLPKPPGSRESRWTHLLCGCHGAVNPATEASGESRNCELSFEQRVDRLEQEVREIRQMMALLVHGHQRQ